jgi:hypothetical protein
MAKTAKEAPPKKKKSANGPTKYSRFPTGDTDRVYDELVDWTSRAGDPQEMRRNVFVLLLFIAACDEPVPEDRQLSLAPVGRPPPVHPLINYTTINNININITSISITIGPTCDCSFDTDCGTAADSAHYRWCSGSCLCKTGTCGAGTANCNYTDATQNDDHCETSTVGDPNNCGGCGVPCNGQTCCSSSCVTIHTDAHCFGCGACGGANPPTCVGGTTFGCCPSANYLDCGGTCADKTVDPNCGSCGNNCGAIGKLCCSQACVDPKLNGNCGGCGVTCTGTDTCSVYNGTGKCCPAGQINCNGTCQAPNGSCGCTVCSGTTCCNHACVDTNSDQTNCGGCAMVCSTANIDTGKPECSGGQCTGTCLAGYADCAGTKRTTGCQTNLNTDNSNCGMCGNACTAPANGTNTCTSGGCVIACNSGYKLCKGLCIPSGNCCLDSECTFPPNDCTVQVGTCKAGSCDYRTITCPAVDCKNPPMCSKGTCVYSDKTVGTPCGTTGCYTATGGTPPTCQLDGSSMIYCNGTPKDCSMYNGPCTKGVCDATSGACGPSPINDGMTCSSDACQISPTCVGGQCVGMPKDCPAPPQCHISTCDPASGSCNSDKVSPESASCVLDDCHANSHCDVNGNCVGDVKQDGTPCLAPPTCSSGNALCVNATCICDTDYDAGMPMQGADMAKPKTHKSSGCEAASGAPAAGGGLVALMLGLIVWGLRRRRA